MTCCQCCEIDASGVYYRELNAQIRNAVQDGSFHVILKNVTGQRYIGTNLHDAVGAGDLAKVRIDIYGTPGNDLGAFLDGPSINVYGNIMDASGNTMNNGRIVAHGRGGDITGFSARGGELFIRDNAGYRVGIHMKEYESKRPVMVIGGTTQDFLGEYMAGGVIIIMGLGLKNNETHYANHIGTGMHGGKILIRGNLDDHQLGSGVGIAEITEDDAVILDQYINEYAKLYSIDVSNIVPQDFRKLTPLSSRPYKQLYAY